MSKKIKQKLTYEFIANEETKDKIGKHLAKLFAKIIFESEDFQNKLYSSQRDVE